MHALLDGPPDDLQRRLDEARDRLKASLKLASGSLEDAVLPTAGDLRAFANADVNLRLPVMATVQFTARLPEGQPLSFRFPDVLGTVILTVEQASMEPLSEPVEPGRWSTPIGTPPPPVPDPPSPPPLPVATPPKAEVVPARPSEKRPALRPFLKRAARAAVRSVPDAPAIAATPIAMAEPPSVTPAPEIQANAQPPEARPSPFAGYVRLGFTHILPGGLDHILFVLGLFLISRNAKDLVKQVTAFTLAHSITLGLALYGVVRLPASIVEPVIALSIAFVAIENLFTTEMKAWRPYVVFAFGLVHGLGFAGALQDTGLPGSQFLPALLAFNVGVELGQLAVVALALLAVGWFRTHAQYRRYVIAPASIAIAAVALFWTVERIL